MPRTFVKKPGSKPVRSMSASGTHPSTKPAIEAPNLSGLLLRNLHQLTRISKLFTIYPYYANLNEVP